MCLIALSTIDFPVTNPVAAVCGSCIHFKMIFNAFWNSFNPFTGVYDLQGNVHVEIGDRIITGDAAQVSMYKLEVHGQGNITLREGDITFDCDTVDVYGKAKTAYVAGNMNFTQGDMIISADTGSFNWSTKNAVFNGNVIVNGEPKNGEVIYNVREKVFVN